MAITTELEGIGALQHALKTIPKLARAELVRLVARSSGAVFIRAIQLVPHERGDLREAIQQQGRGLSARVGIAHGDTGRGGSGSHADPSIYGRFVEFGSIKNQPPKPFMRTAVDEEAVRFDGRVRETAGFLERVSARGGGA